MRSVWGVLGLLLTLAIVVMLARKQTTALVTPPPVGVSARPSEGASQPHGEPIQKQIDQAVSHTLQQARPMPEEK
mgnify:CR=1 FL=1